MSLKSFSSQKPANKLRSSLLLTVLQQYNEDIPFAAFKSSPECSLSYCARTSQPKTQNAQRTSDARHNPRSTEVPLIQKSWERSAAVTHRCQSSASTHTHTHTQAHTLQQSSTVLKCVLYLYSYHKDSDKSCPLILNALCSLITFLLYIISLPPNRLPSWTVLFF